MIEAEKNKLSQQKYRKHNKENILAILLIFLNLVCIVSSAFLMWICYKREEKSYLSSITVVSILYHFLYIELGISYISLTISIIYICVIWAIIKAYSNKINREYNKNLLKTIQEEYAQFEAQSKTKK